MGFEKMTPYELFKIFVSIFPGWDNLVVEYEKIGARALKMTTVSGIPLYFMWYDDTNWTLGTKLYRKRPEKQKKVQKKIDALKNELATLDAQHDAAMNVAKGFTRLSGASSPYLDVLKVY